MSSSKIIDRLESKLQFAKGYAADEVILMTNNRKESQSSNDFANEEANEILKRKNIEACNVVFDCTGAEVCVQMSVYVSRIVHILPA